MKLDEWMTNNRLSDGDVAQMLSIDRTTVSRLRRGKARPGWALLPRIAEMTGGSVRAEDFVNGASEAAE